MYLKIVFYFLEMKSANHGGVGTTMMGGNESSWDTSGGGKQASSVGGAAAAGVATNYALPDEAEEKLQYAFRMIMDAHRSKTMTSENEVRSLRGTIEELRVANSNLTKKLQSAEREIMDQQHRCQVLQKDNESLAMANRQLLQRCEKYKRIQQTFSEALENSGHEDDLSGFASLTTTSNSGEYRSAIATGASYMPQSSGSGGMTTTSSSSSSAGNSGIVSSVVPAALSSMSPKTVTTGMTASSAAPGPASSSFDSNGKDGKQFFRIVRTRLPFESFNSFLTVIKKLNSHEYTRDVAVEEAKKIFGAENADLLGDFQALISRHISSSSTSGAPATST